MPANWIRRTILIFTGATPITFSLSNDGNLVYRFFAGIIISMALAMLFKVYQQKTSDDIIRNIRRIKEINQEYQYRINRKALPKPSEDSANVDDMTD